MDLVSRTRQLLDPMDPIPTGVPPALDPLPGIQAVIFDVYGTLFTSGSGDIGVAAATHQDHALREALGAAGLPADSARIADWIHAVKTSHAAARARGVACPEIETRAIWRQVLKIPASPEQIEQLAVEYECRVNPVWPMPGVQEVLAWLREQDVLLGIVSNAQFYTPLLFAACLGAPPIAMGFSDDLCTWSYLAGEAKPAPSLFEPVRHGLHERGLDPRHALYVGNDMLNDIWTATQVGLRTCLFAGDRRSLRMREQDDRCRALRPDRTLTALDQLPDILRAEAPGQR